MYIPRDSLNRGIIPDNYHLFTSNELISTCIYYECEKTDEKVSII